MIFASFCVFAAIPYFLSVCSSAKVKNSEAKLMAELLENYPGAGVTRPIENVLATMNVTFRMKLNELISVHEHTGVMTITAMVESMWTDEYLQWKPADFEGVDAIPVRPRDIFLPKIIPVGSAGDRTPVFDISDNDNHAVIVWVDNKGTVDAKVTGTFETSCKLDTRNFPFDQQRCQFFFKTLHLKRARVALTIDQDHQSRISHFIDSKAINDNPYWKVASVESEVVSLNSGGSNYSTVIYTIIVQRRAQYYINNIILPNLAMSAVQLSVFLLPFETQRVIFSITGVLVLDVFHSSLMSKMGASEPIPLEKYSTAQFIIGILITVESILVMRFVALRNDQVPKWLAKWVPRPSFSQVPAIVIRRPMRTNANTPIAEHSLMEEANHNNPAEKLRYQSSLSPGQSVFTNNKGDGMTEINRNIISRPQSLYNVDAESQLEMSTSCDTHHWLFTAYLIDKISLVLSMLALALLPILLFTV